MRNLKRVLSLVMAMVMLLGMMTIGAAAASADFPDAGEITYVEAVDVLTGIGVMEGTTVDGSGELHFVPGMILSRAQAAAMMTRILAGPANAKKVSANAEQIFIDVPSDHWAAGYIRYCANLGLLAGYDGYFFPEQQLTGVAFAKMLLVALGYNAEYEGYTNAGDLWASNVGVDAIANGIDLEGILLSDYVNREQAAQMILQFLEADMVDYTTGYYAGTVYPVKADKNITNDYDLTGTATDDTLQAVEAYFPGVVKFNDAITSNEYADLYDTSPLRAGKTKIGGKVYDVSTTLEDIGEAHYGWADGSDVLYMTNVAASVYETGDKKDIGSAKKFSNVTDGISYNSDTEWYLNFGGDGKVYSSPYRIEYMIDFTAGDFDEDGTNETAAEVRELFAEYCGLDEADLPANQDEQVIKAKATFTSKELAIIEGIFYTADDSGASSGVIGYVYVGSQSKDDPVDVSNEMHYDDFYDKYINDDTAYAAIDANENGNWLKVIDNDGDGVAEYVLKTIYTFAQVEDIDKDGDITLDTDDKTFGHTHDAINELDGEGVVTEDELAEGDIVYYALIDGSAYTWLADVVTAEIDKVNRNTLTATTTDGDEYVESGVHNHIQDTDLYESGVKNLAGDIKYDLYLDKYGYVGVFAETATSGDFVLLTDGWFDYRKTGREYSVRAYIDGEISIVDVAANGDLFIYDDDDAQGDNNAWGLLKKFGNVAETHTDLNASAPNTIWTTVVSLNEDNELIPVGHVFNRKDIEMIDLGKTLLGRAEETGTLYNSNMGRGAEHAYTETVDAEQVEVRGLSSTVYYYVYRSGSRTIVDEYVGYAKRPSVDVDDIEDVYAVATAVTRATDPDNVDYYNANVVVVELKGSYKTSAEIVFVYDSPEVHRNVEIETLYVVMEDGTLGQVDVDLSDSEYRDDREYNPAWGKFVYPGLYWLWETSEDGVYTITELTADEIEDEGFTVGSIRTNDWTGAEDWSEVRRYWLGDGDDVIALDERKVDDYEDDLTDIVYNRDETVRANTPEYRNLEDSCYYTLGYDYDGRWTAADGKLYNEYDADMELQDDYEEVMAEFVTEDRKDYHNTVLVSYNRDNDIVYAISFAHLDGSAANEAQNVWARMIREEPEEDEDPVPEVIFYGVKDNEASGKDLNTADDDITVSWQTASTFSGTPLVVNHVLNWSVSPAVETNTSQKSYTLTYVDADGLIYTVDLVQNARSTVFGTLYSTNLALAEVTDNSASDNVVDYMNVPDKSLTLTDLQNILRTTNGDKVTVTGYGAGETPLEMNQSVANTVKIVITLENADGGKKTIEIANTDINSDTKYTVTFGDEVKSYAVSDFPINLTTEFGAVAGRFVIKDAAGTYYDQSGSTVSGNSIFIAGANATSVAMPTAATNLIIEDHYWRNMDEAPGPYYKYGSQVRLAGYTVGGYYNITNQSGSVVHATVQASAAGELVFTMPDHNIAVSNQLYKVVLDGEDKYLETGNAISGLTNGYYVQWDDADDTTPTVAAYDAVLTLSDNDDIVETGYVKIGIGGGSGLTGRAAITDNLNSVVKTNHDTYFVKAGSVVTITIANGVQFTYSGKTYEGGVEGKDTLTLTVARFVP